MVTTEQLINSLAADVKPVRRLRPLWWRCAVWIFFAALIVVTGAISHGLRPDLAERLAEPVFSLRTLSALATGILAVVAAFMVSLPDRSERWAWLPLPALAIWIFTIGYGCLFGWMGLGPEGITANQVVECLATLVLTGSPLALAMFLMLRRAAPLRPTPATLSGALAVAAFVATALFIFHELDASVLVLIWNFGTAALIVGLASLFAKAVALRATEPA